MEQVLRGKESKMNLLKRKRGPDKPFQHADDCKILMPALHLRPVDLDAGIGFWVAICRCGEEHYREPTEARVRQNRSTGPRPATCRSASSSPRPTPPSSGLS